jgi:outer membrane protein assembly factor BamB
MEPSELKSLQTGYRTAFGIAVVAGIISITVAVLLAANYFRTTAAPPLTSNSMQQLIAQVQRSPDNEALKMEIRQFDLLARKAYFAGVWFTRIGSFLLLAGIATALIALRAMSVMRRKLPDPRAYPPIATEEDSAATARWFVMGTGIVLVVIAASMAVLFRNELGATGRQQSTDNVPQALVTNGVVPTAGAVSVPPTPAGSGALTSRPASVVATNAAAMKKNWPSFRGYNGNGIAEYTNAPLSWDGPSGKNIIWKTATPKSGLSSPVVWGNRVFVTSADSQSREVDCFDAATGKILWQAPVANIPGSPATSPKVNADTGYAAPTVATDGERVFAIFATGDLICLDLQGKKIWAMNVGTPKNMYGYASSPVLCGSLLIVQYDQEAATDKEDFGGRLLALEAATGKKVWDIARQVEPSWTSPLVADTGAGMQVVIVANPIVAAYDPFTGKELWTNNCMGGEIGPSAAYADGMVFAANESVRLAAIKVSAPSTLAWEADGGLPNTSSPVANSNYLFMATSGGTIVCHDAKTGALVWRQENDEGFYSSPIIVGDRVYIVDRAGVTHVIKVARELSELGKSALGEKSDATPAFMDGRIYMRGVTNLYCIAAK